MRHTIASAPALLFVNCIIELSSLTGVLAGVVLDRPNEQPAIKNQLTVKAREHDTVLLPCYLDNTAGSTVRWWRDDTLVADSSSSGIVPWGNLRLFPNHTLEISDTSWQDTASYLCQVIRPHPWSPINQRHYLLVQYPAAVKMTPVAGTLEAQLGQEVSMTCQPTGIPKPNITWTFKDKEIELLSSRTTLRFTPNRADMAGEYACIADNGVEEPAKASSILVIAYPPEVIAEKIWIHTSPGMRSILSCLVKGVPIPKVEWYFDKRLVKIEGTGGRIGSQQQLDPGDQSSRRHHLIIRHTRSSDFGYYTCSANNSLGHQETVIQLSGVANVAVFKASPSNNLPVRQAAEDSYTLMWEVDSYSPIIEYKLHFREKRDGYTVWPSLIIPADEGGVVAGAWGLDPEGQGSAPLHTGLYTLRGLRRGGYVYEAFVLSRNKFGWSRPSAIFRFSTLDNRSGLTTPYSGTETEESYGESTETNTIDSSDYSTVGEQYTSKMPPEHSPFTPLLVLCSLSVILIKAV